MSLEPLAYYNDNDPNNVAWLIELIARGIIAPGDVDGRSIRDVRSEDLAGYTQCHFFAGIGVWSYAARLADAPHMGFLVPSFYGRIPIWRGYGGSINARLATEAICAFMTTL